MELLLAVWRDPEAVRTLSMAQWNLLLRTLRSYQLDARFSFLLEDRGLEAGCPAPVWDELLAQRFYPRFLHAQTRLEIYKLVKALAAVDTPIILLKGAGYMQAGLPLARGRLFSDLDILVPRQRLAAAEAALTAAGWQSLKVDAYDQRYYRRWMHEVPPLRHPDRAIVIDLHHAILPLTSRLRPDPELLWEDAVALPRAPLRVLSPIDMLLHSAAHLFHDGEVRGGFANLLDLHEMLLDLGRTPGLFDLLPVRAERLDLGRPLFYALLFCRELLGTPLPQTLIDRCRVFAPAPLPLALMRGLVPPVLTPRPPTRRPAGFATWLLYLRSHWLRMPPGLLAAHLGRKLLRRGPGQP